MPDRMPEPGPQVVEIPVMYAEELPGPKLDGTPHLLMVKCHRLSMMRVRWDPYERVAVMICAECGAVGVALKVEKKNRLALDPQRPAGQASILGANGKPPEGP